MEKENEGFDEFVRESERENDMILRMIDKELEE